MNEQRKKKAKQNIYTNTSFGMQTTSPSEIRSFFLFGQHNLNVTHTQLDIVIVEQFHFPIFTLLKLFVELPCSWIERMITTAATTKSNINSTQSFLLFICLNYVIVECHVDCIIFIRSIHRACIIMLSAFVVLSVLIHAATQTMPSTENSAHVSSAFSVDWFTTSSFVCFAIARHRW